MNNNDLKGIAEGLIDEFNYAAKESIRLYEEGLKIQIKEDKSPVSNGDLRVNDLISKKISKITPDIPIISEETVDLSKKNYDKLTSIALKAHKLLRCRAVTRSDFRFYNNKFYLLELKDQLQKPTCLNLFCRSVLELFYHQTFLLVVLILLLIYQLYEPLLAYL